jgi:uncharacterized membrane protein
MHAPGFATRGKLKQCQCDVSSWGLVQKRAGRLGLVTMTLLAVGVAVYSFRFIGVLADVWLEIDQGIRGVITNVPVQALTHMLIAPIALILGAFQFFPSIRSKNPHVHRWTGRAYVTVCVVAGLAGLATAPFASGGPVAGLGFGILAVLWIGTTIAAWRAAV